MDKKAGPLPPMREPRHQAQGEEQHRSHELGWTAKGVAAVPLQVV